MVGHRGRPVTYQWHLHGSQSLKLRVKGKPNSHCHGGEAKTEGKEYSIRMLNPKPCFLHATKCQLGTGSSKQVE